MKIFNKYNSLLNIFLELLFLSNFLFSNSQILNHLIRLGHDPFKYNHFSYNSDGDLIIYMPSESGEKVRNFFGIKKDGQEYFTDNLGNTNYYYSINITNEEERSLDELCFIKINSTSSNLKGKEFLIGISKRFKSKTEFYDLDNKYEYSYSTDELFGDTSITTFSIIPDPLNTDTEFNYFITYLTDFGTNIFRLCTMRVNFYFNNFENKGINKVTMENIISGDQDFINCFFTGNYLYICLFIDSHLALNIWTFDPVTGQGEKTDVCDFFRMYFQRFYKGIHLKDNIGFFVFLKMIEINHIFLYTKFNQI